MTNQEKVDIGDFDKEFRHSEEEPIPKNKNKGINDLDITGGDQNSNKDDSTDRPVQNTKSCSLTKRAKIFIIIGAVVVVGLIVLLAIIFSIKPPPPKPKNSEIPKQEPAQPESIKKEFEISTKPRDLKEVTVIQKLIEKIDILVLIKKN